MKKIKKTDTTKSKISFSWPQFQQGFTLIEILIALTIFSIFISSFLTSQGNNVNNSNILRKEGLLKSLCLSKINQIIMHPPDLRDSLTLAPQKGTFKEEGHEEYEFEIIYKKMVLPDFNKLIGTEEGEGGTDPSDPNKAYQKKVMDIIRKNINKMLWQVSVTVNEVGTEFPYTLTSVIIDKKAKVKISF